MNIANVWEIARKNYQEGSKEFNELVSATVRPVQILHELVVSQGVTNKHFKNNALLKAKHELDKELNNRLVISRVMQKTNKTTNSHLRLA
ncbi:MAG: hypothetical protein O3C19_07890 [Bacteroidetes bacterium]|nr:hypothetical protein [Bacteroidota bacterium]